MEKRALIVEDDPVHQELLKDILEGCGWSTRGVAGVAEALSELEAGGFALVITDVYLPDATGLELCRRIKSNPASSGIPVLVTTGAFLDSALTRLAEELGADEFLGKPLRLRQFLGAVDRLVAAVA